MTAKHDVTRGICGICPAGCWVLVTYDGKGRLSSVRADDSSPLGMICPLGEHSAEIVYAKERLTSPLKRRGPKGSYEFEKIGWDDALDEIAHRLRAVKAESGPEATAIYTGRGSFELAMCDVFQPAGVAVSSASSVLFPFGSPNTLGVGALCYVSYAMIAPHVTMGGMHDTMFSDIENAEMIVVWGANPATDCPPLDFERIRDAFSRGARVVVIDPRRTMTAKMPGAIWVPIRPGTDGALALGVCHILISRELFDEDFVRSWTHGFDEFARYVGHFRPRRFRPSPAYRKRCNTSLRRRSRTPAARVRSCTQGLSTATVAFSPYGRSWSSGPWQGSWTCREAGASPCRRTGFQSTGRGLLQIRI